MRKIILGLAVLCGPGHNGEIVRDRRGRDWMPYHTYWKGNGYKGRLMLTARVPDFSR